MKQSFLSALSGWLAGSFLFASLWAFTEGKRHMDQIGGLLLLATLYSAPMILIVWLVALWPLYVRIPANAAWWHRKVCVPFGAVTGALIYFLFIHFAFGFHLDSSWSFPHLILGAIVGSVMCAVGVRFKRNETKIT